MKFNYLKKLMVTSLLACAYLPLSGDNQALQIAERFITTFYSWDRSALQEQMTENDDHQAVIYYQGWAEGGNYAIKIRRPCLLENDAISCSITVTDNFGQAMGYIATDTFRLLISNGQISEVTFTADDPPIFEELQQWIMTERPEVLTGPCLDMFAGGNTPQACAKTVSELAEEFMTIRESEL